MIEQPPGCTMPPLDTCTYCGLPDREDDHFTGADCIRALRADRDALVLKLNKITQIIRSRPAEPDVYECADMIELIRDEL